MAVSPTLMIATIVALLSTSAAQSLTTRGASTATPTPSVHVVDQTGKSVGSHPTLSAAVKVARPGDSILVRPGSYQAVSVQKGIRILGDAGAKIDVTYSPFQVSGLPHDQTFVLAGFEFLWPRPVRVELTDNLGQVHLSNLRVLPMLINRAPGITIENCTFVSLDRCITHGTPALRIVRSEVIVSHCEFQGIGSYRGRFVGNAIQATHSKVIVCQPQLRGYTDAFGWLSAPAVGLELSELWIKGDQNSYVQGGSTLVGTAVTPIDGGHFSKVYLDPTTPLNPFASSKAKITSRTTVILKPLAMVTAGGHLSPAGVLDATLMGSPGSLVAIAIGVPEHRRPTVFGDVWLKASSALSLGIGVTDPAGRFTTSFRIPARISPGSCILLQGFIDAGKGLHLSLPSVTAIH